MEMNLTYECPWVTLIWRITNPRGDNGEGIRQKQKTEMEVACEFQYVILHDFDIANCKVGDTITYLFESKWQMEQQSCI